MNKMIKLETLTESQTETLVGGWGRWGFPSVSSKSSTNEFTNLTSQTNIGSAWASSSTATGGGGGWVPAFLGISAGGDSGEAKAELTQTNTNKTYFVPSYPF